MTPGTLLGAVTRVVPVHLLQLVVAGARILLVRGPDVDASFATAFHTPHNRQRCLPRFAHHPHVPFVARGNKRKNLWKGDNKGISRGGNARYH